MSSVRILFLGGEYTVFEDCQTVGDIMLRVALSQNRLASDVVVLRAGSSQVLKHDATAPKDVSIVLKNEEEELDEEEWKINVILHSQVEDTATVVRALAVLPNVTHGGEEFPWPTCTKDILLEAARHEATEKVLRTLLAAGFHGGRVLEHFAKYGDAVAVRSLIRAGVNVNSTREALADACKGGHKTVVRVLINAQAEINYKGSIKNLLLPAVTNGHKEVVHILIDARVLLDNNLEFCCTIFFDCVQQNEDMIRIMIDARSEYDGLLFDTSLCLRRASRNGQKKIVQMLIDAKKDVNFCSSSPSALYEASSEGHANVVEILMDAQAEINRNKCMIISPLWIASAKGHTDVVEILLDAQAHLRSVADTGDYDLYDALCGASSSGCTETAKLLTNALAKTKYFSEYWEALHLACTSEHAEVVKLLTNARMAVNGVDCDGETALMKAADKSEEIVRILINAQAEVNQVCNDGRSALSRASESGMKEIVEILTDAGGVIFGE